MSHHQKSTFLFDNFFRHICNHHEGNYQNHIFPFHNPSLVRITSVSCGVIFRLISADFANISILSCSRQKKVKRFSFLLYISNLFADFASRGGIFFGQGIVSSYPFVPMTKPPYQCEDQIKARPLGQAPNTDRIFRSLFLSVKRIISISSTLNTTQNF